MKRLKRRIISVLLVLATCIGFFVLPVSATEKTPDEAIKWVNSLLGQTVGLSQSRGECVGLIAEYFRFLGVPSLNGNANTYISRNDLPAGWRRYQGVHPQKGDILLYSGTKEYPYGHVAIYESDYVSYHQNTWPKIGAAPERKVAKRGWRYDKLVNPYWGVLRPNWNSAPIPVTVTWTDYSKHSISTSQPIAVLGKQANFNVSKPPVTQVGINLYDAAGKKVTGRTDAVTFNYTTYIYMSYDVASELRYRLISGLKYQYEFWVVVNGKQYTSPRYTFTAGGTPASYSIKYDATGGNAELASSTVTVGNPYGNLPAATRDGYAFDGWYTYADGGTQITSATTVTSTASHTLYAHWTKIETPPSIYTITLDFNDGTMTSTTTTTDTDGRLYNLPTPTRDGYTFDGWYTEPAGGVLVDERIEFIVDATLFAHWTEVVKPPSIYTITLDFNDGTMMSTTATTDADGRLYNLPTPTRDGYAFDGWYTYPEGGVLVDERIEFIVDATLFAHWTKVETPPPIYTISFAPNGGIVEPVTAATGTDGKLSSLPTPIRDGYTFDGWHTAPDGGVMVDEDTEYTEDTTIYAHWTKGETPPTVYTITFIPNGGTMSSTLATTGTDGKLNALPTPIRDGYTFDGWYTATSGGAKVMANNKYTADTILYAHWTKVEIHYTITFDPNGGTVNPSSGTTGTNGKLNVLPIPTRTGYTFDGWYTSTNGGVKVDKNYTFAKNETVYAHWTQDTAPSDMLHGRITISATFTEGESSGDVYTIGGETVTLHVYPDAGYRLSAIQVVGPNGQLVPLSNNGNVYTFTMPAFDVTVSPKFAKIQNTRSNFKIE